MVAQASYLGTQRVEASRLEIQRYPGHRNELEAKCDPVLNKKIIGQLTGKKKSSEGKKK